MYQLVFWKQLYKQARKRVELATLICKLVAGFGGTACETGTYV